MEGSQDPWESSQFQEPPHRIFSWFRNHVQWVFTSLIFLGLPFLLTARGLGTIWDRLEKGSLAACFAELDEKLLLIEPEGSTVKLFEARLRQVLNAPAQPGSAAGLLADLQHLARENPGVVSFTLATSTGFVVQGGLGAVPDASAALELFALAREVRSSEKVDRMAIGERLKPLSRHLGPLIGGEEFPGMVRESRVVPAHPTDQNRYCFLGGNDVAWAWVRLTQTPQWEGIRLNDALRKVRTALEKPGWEFGLVNLDDPASGAGDLAGVVAQYQSSMESHVSLGKRLYSILPGGPSVVLYASRRKEDASNFDQWRQLLTTAGTLLFAAGTWIAHRSICGGRTFSISIRVLLMGLFLFSSGLPLVASFLEGWGYFQNGLAVRIRESQEEAKRSLIALDRCYPQFRGSLERTVRGLLSPCRGGPAQDRNSFLAVLEEIQRQFHPKSLAVFDHQGEVTWDRNPKSSKRKKRNFQMIGGLLKDVMGILNTDRPAPVFIPKPDSSEAEDDFASFLASSFKEASTKVSGAILTSMVGIDNLPLHLASKNLNQLFDFSLGTERNFTFLAPIMDAQGTTYEIVMMTWDKRDLETQFFSRRLHRAQESLLQSRLMAMTHDGSTVIPAQAASVARQLGPMIRLLNLGQPLADGKVEEQGHSHFVTAIKSKEISEFVLLCLQPEAPLLAEFESLRSRLFVFAAASLGISLFLGFLLSRRFLDPVKELGQGVRAIEQRDFRFRVQVERRDELGELGRTFNHMMEGLADLELGGALQGQLFPQEPLELGEYTIFGLSRPASQLGGDYFDYLAIHDHSMIGLIGDASGHGVPAAIIMIMAKTVFLQASRQESPPQAFLQNFNWLLREVVRKHLKKRMMMTGLFFRLDARNHTLTFLNGGHHYPYLAPHQGDGSYVEIPGVIFGTKGADLLKEKTVILEPGARCYMVTDGLLESIPTVPDSRENPFQVLGNLFQAVPPLPLKEACASFFASHPLFLSRGRQEDDCTLLILERKKA